MNPLFITAHYDDLEVCAGGTAKRYGGQSVVLYSHEDHGTQEEAEQAASCLGITILPVKAKTEDRETVKLLDKMLGDITTIIAVSPWDSHPEHQRAASIARQVARNNSIPLWFMDHTIPGGYGQGPRPNYFVNISNESPDKYRAIRSYLKVMKLYGPEWLTTISARDRYYGGIHGIWTAEGFTIQDSIQ